MPTASEHCPRCGADEVAYSRWECGSYLWVGYDGSFQQTYPCEIRVLKKELQQSQREARTNDGVLFSDLASQYVKQLADRCDEVKELRLHNQLLRDRLVVASVQVEIKRLQRKVAIYAEHEDLLDRTLTALEGQLDKPSELADARLALAVFMAAPDCVALTDEQVAAQGRALDAAREAKARGELF